MATAIAATAANLYYNQPLFPSIKDSFDLDDGAVGLIPSASQLGYSAAILLISPSGDVMSRRSLIGYLSILLTLTLLAVFAAPSFFVLAIAFFAVGLGANSTQQLLPIGASLAPLTAARFMPRCRRVLFRQASVQRVPALRQHPLPVGTSKQDIGFSTVGFSGRCAFNPSDRTRAKGPAERWRYRPFFRRPRRTVCWLTIS
ncbi:MFS transporter [Loktanella sp. R86503]|uniref:MFS transporter n=1 Tax=Loktanella sp. R86503 TaxID=3093847 RepID=UPI0036D92307